MFRDAEQFPYLVCKTLREKSPVTNAMQTGMIDLSHDDVEDGFVD